MMIDLSSVQDNPFRDFDLDPIDSEQVESLARSIDVSSFWGGILVRPNGDGYQLVFGHHRIRALRRAGWTEADLNVVDFPDYLMAKVMVTENATQRRGVATVLEAVAAAIKVLGPVLLAEDKESFSTFVPNDFTNQAFGRACGSFKANGTIGHDLIRSYLGQDYTDRQIRTALDFLSKSGKTATYVAAMSKGVDAALEDAAQKAKEEASINPRVGSLLGVNFNAAKRLLTVLTTERSKRWVPKDKQYDVVSEVLGYMRNEQKVDKNSDLTLSGSNYRTNLNQAVEKFIDDGLRWLETIEPEFTEEEEALKIFGKFNQARTTLTNQIDDFVTYIEEGAYKDHLEIDLGPAFAAEIQKLIDDLMTVRDATGKVVSNQ